MTSHSPSHRRIIVLGSTGSIGTNTLEVIEHLHRETEHRFILVGLAAGRTTDLLLKQAERFDVKNIAIAEPPGDLAAPPGTTVHEGPDAACELIEAVARAGDLVVAAMVGSAGLPAVLAAIDRGCDIALANKETLVAAGAIVMPLARQKGVQIIPVDSEHSAVFQCLAAGRSIDEVRRVVLTASGGPFRDATREEIDSATVDQALNHPTWSMGAKVTIDSATLMNKALEVIEAHWLFGLEADRIDAIIHPQSIIHSFVEFVDGAVFAQLSPPDMKSPIQYALTWPHRIEGCCRQLDWGVFSRLDFQPIDSDRFPAIEMALEVVRCGGSAGAVLNAANEVAVAAFLDHRIAFADIWRIVAETMRGLPSSPAPTLNDVLRADADARAFATDLLPTRSGVAM